MGTMPFLVTDGGNNFSLTNQTNLGIGNYNRRTCIPDFSNSIGIERIGSIPPIIRKTMVEENAH